MATTAATFRVALIQMRSGLDMARNVTDAAEMIRARGVRPRSVPTCSLPIMTSAVVLSG